MTSPKRSTCRSKARPPPRVVLVSSLPAQVSRPPLLVPWSVSKAFPSRCSGRHPFEASPQRPPRLFTAASTAVFRPGPTKSRCPRSWPREHCTSRPRIQAAPPETSGLHPTKGVRTSAQDKKERQIRLRPIPTLKSSRKLKKASRASTCLSKQLDGAPFPWPYPCTSSLWTYSWRGSRSRAGTPMIFTKTNAWRPFC